jgi:hypothetical protein
MCQRSAANTGSKFHHHIDATLIQSWVPTGGEVQAENLLPSARIFGKNQNLGKYQHQKWKAVSETSNPHTQIPVPTDTDLQYYNTRVTHNIQTNQR